MTRLRLTETLMSLLPFLRRKPESLPTSEATPRFLAG